MPAQYFCPVCSKAFCSAAARQCHRVGRRCLSEAELRAKGWTSPTGRAWHLPVFSKKKDKA